MSGNASNANLFWTTYQPYTLFIYSLHCFEAVLSLTGNTLTLIAIRKTKNLKKVPTNVFIMSLASSDAIIGLLIPVFVGVKFLDTEQFSNGTMCLLHGPYFSMFIISLMILLAIAVDRYLAIVHSLSYKQRMTLRRAKIITVVIWIVSLCSMTSLTCYYSFKRNVSEQGIRIIGSLYPKFVLMILLQIGIIGPLLGNIVLYILIYIKLKTKTIFRGRGINNGLNESATSKPTKAYVNMMVLVLVYLGIACIPYYVILVILKEMTSSTPVWFVYLFDTSTVLFYSNCFMNPFIYSWKNRNFRNAYKTIMTVKRSSSVVPSERTRTIFISMDTY